VDRRGRIAAIELADVEAHPHAELVGRSARGDVDGAAVRVPAEESALRTAEHLDSLHLRKVGLQEAPRGLPDAVDVDADTGQAANVELRSADAAARRIRDEIRYHDAEIGTGIQI